MEDEQLKSLWVPDLIKIKVLNNGHYYILSRHLLRTQLRAVGFNKQASAAVAKAVKEGLLGQKKLQVSNEALLAAIVDHARTYDPTNSLSRKFLTFAKFIQIRPPVVLALRAVGSLAKETAAILAEQFNFANVLHTNVVRVIANGLTSATPITPALVRRAASCDIEKAFKEGKWLIIEGQSDLLPQLFFQQDGPVIELRESEFQGQSIQQVVLAGGQHLSRNLSLVSPTGSVRKVTLGIAQCFTLREQSQTQLPGSRVGTQLYSSSAQWCARVIQAILLQAIEQQATFLQ